MLVLEFSGSCSESKEEIIDGFIQSMKKILKDEYQLCIDDIVCDVTNVKVMCRNNRKKRSLTGSAEIHYRFTRSVEGGSDTMVDVESDGRNHSLAEEEPTTESSVITEMGTNGSAVHIVVDDQTDGVNNGHGQYNMNNVEIEFDVVGMINKTDISQDISEDDQMNLFMALADIAYKLTDEYGDIVIQIGNHNLSAIDYNTTQFVAIEARCSRDEVTIWDDIYRDYPLCRKSFVIMTYTIKHSQRKY